ncbi:MAG: proteasome accessory factor, partial [Actinomycetota bacterium]|nr:proteasome accessory factor [Actinomycetota bacterium]
SGLDKLGRALRITSNGNGDARVNIELEHGSETHLRTLQKALHDGKRVHLEYLSASRGSLSERTVDPWGLIAALGHWYLVAFDHSSEEERMFRLDRVKAATIVAEDADVPDDFDPKRYRGAFTARDEEPNVSFEISPEVSRWFEDYYPVVRSATTDDGWRKVELVASSERWAAILVLRLGAGVRAIEPPGVADQARSMATSIAARHA